MKGTVKEIEIFYPRAQREIGIAITQCVDGLISRYPGKVDTQGLRTRDRSIAGVRVTVALPNEEALAIEGRLMELVPQLGAER